MAHYSRHILLILAFPFYVTRGSAASDSTAAALTRDDSAMVRSRYTFSEIIVTALRVPQTALVSSSLATVLNAADLRSVNGSSLADLLTVMPSLFVKDYGGTSGLKTIAQRGLGPEHTLVLLNGMRVSNPQNGLLDLGLIGVDEIDRIEALRGGHSAAFGSDAVAGAVNIITNPIGLRHAVSVSTTAGSFGYRRVRLSAAGSIDSVWIGVAYRDERGDESFPFVFRNGPQRTDLVRRNSDFSLRAGTLQSVASFANGVQLSLFGRAFDSERGVGGQVVGPASTSVARQSDRDNLLQLQFEGSSADNARYRLGLQYHHAYERYRDPVFMIGYSSLDNYYRNSELRIEPSLTYRFGATTAVLGGEYASTDASGNMLRMSVERTNIGGYLAVESRLIEGDGTMNVFSLTPALRYDVSRTGSANLANWSPQIGMMLLFERIGGWIQPGVRASVSRNFRTPTFNELLFGGGGGIGNPNLNPERSTSVELGGEAVISRHGSHELQLNAFIIDMNDRITWVAAGNGMATPKNLRRVQSRGIEASYSGMLFDENVSLRANTTFSSTRKVTEDSPGDPNVGRQLIYVPRLTANARLAFSQRIEHPTVKRVNAAFGASIIGSRFTTEDNQYALPQYTLFNCNAGMEVEAGGFSLDARIEINNLFNEEYQAIISYPMPGRSYRVTLGVTH